jgi:hypothetical protein
MVDYCADEGVGYAEKIFRNIYRLIKITERLCINKKQKRR